MVDRKTIVLKSHFDPDTVRLLGEKLKSKLLTKIGPLELNPEEVRLASVEKYYEPCILISGRYNIDYQKKCNCTIKVDGNPQEVVILDRKFVPELPSGASPNSSKVIRLAGVAYFHHEDEAYCIIDNMGGEVNPKELSWAPSEEQTMEALTKAGTKFIEVKISPEEETEFLRSRIAKRPPDVGKATKETFEINERTVIYTPVYQLTFQDIKARRKAIVRIDGVTGKMISDRPGRKSSDLLKRDLTKAGGKTSPPTARGSKKPVQDLKKKTDRPPRMLGASKADQTVRFPPRVAGENGTLVVGDLEIPSGTTLYKTLMVKGYLKIGRDCQVLGTVKALKGITIGANTTVKGNVASGGNVVIHADSLVHGSVESAGRIEVGENTVIEGGLHSKSSVVLKPRARVCVRDQLKKAENSSFPKESSSSPARSFQLFHSARKGV